jgi:hypothetical protein
MTIAIGVLVCAAAIAGFIPGYAPPRLTSYGPCGLNEHAPREIAQALIEPSAGNLPTTTIQLVTPSAIY